MQRRSFLGSMLAAGVAPAFVGSGVLMPVKKIVLPEMALPAPFKLVAWGTNDATYYAADGIHPTEAGAIALARRIGANVLRDQGGWSVVVYPRFPELQGRA